MTNSLSAYMQEIASQVEAKLRTILTTDDQDIASIYKAMEYSAMAGGKRIRPFLVVAVSDMLGGNREAALTFGTALEMIHTYSLIHDDLPAMDNDDLRRGKPTCHKVFGEAGAILAGDGLLTEAFSVLASVNVAPQVVVNAVKILSSAAGAFGMIGGQAMDIESEVAPPDNVEYLKKLCQKKTGALISAAGQLGCLAAGHYNDDICQSILTYTDKIGLSFQMIDDYLDVYAGEETLGKPIGSDIANGKTTFMSFMSGEQVKAEAFCLTEEAILAISHIRDNEMLVKLAKKLLNREN